LSFEMRELNVKEGAGFADLLAVQPLGKVRYEHVIPNAGATTDRIIGFVLSSSAATHSIDLRTMRSEVRRADVSARSAVAETFAARVRAKSGVEEIWVSEEDGLTTVTVITSGFDLDRDLELQAAFSAVGQEIESGGECELDIFALSESFPTDIRSGRSL
jgi:hypothetical protein